jgi:thioredoxin-dependent peroxiredoxin
MKIFSLIIGIAFGFTALAQVSCSQEQSDKKLGLELGAKLPELKVTNQHGKEIPLAAAEGNRWVFVFFYPKAMTGGCTKQVCSVRDAFEELTEQKVSVFGVSTDTAESQLKFSTKEKLNYNLIADTEKKVANAFEVPLIMGKLTARQAYLFKDGVLVWRDVKGATDTQGAEVLQAIKDNADR